MMQNMLTCINSCFPLTELPCGAFAQQKISGINFRIRRFEAARLGSVSAMTAEGFFGLMKMDTLIITPTAADMPLLSYDRIFAMGNDTLLFELYDTLLAPCDLAAVAQQKAAAAALPDHDPGQHWYDDIKLPESLAKKGRKRHRAAFDGCAQAYLAAYLSCAQQAACCESGAKREKTAAYVNGLLRSGGPSTDIFMKALGAEKTAELFHRILFATKP